MVEMICLLTRWLSVKFIFFGIVLMLHCQELNARVTEVRCDPDIPSRPQPDVNVHAIAMPQSDIHVTNCTEGEYLDWYKCSPCQEGTFRTKQIAALDRYSWCQSCQEPVRNYCRAMHQVKRRQNHVRGWILPARSSRNAVQI
ncbi:uncharacterized protein LOC129923705 isoform X3 [Biomphalaria glabrata]|uniref:Uncharacterized protein LOC129923705 isoform X3 n=1 Tax=Biomphalaria glabrata TaxID=6526 RepID=A0A9W2ZB08_BIOGL|nr:uncharacterized protein LOC129923705 isoform X3 [Biomphalaria glabrata]